MFCYEKKYLKCKNLFVINGTILNYHQTKMKYTKLILKFLACTQRINFGAELHLHKILRYVLQF